MSYPPPPFDDWEGVVPAHPLSINTLGANKHRFVGRGDTRWVFQQFADGSVTLEMESPGLHRGATEVEVTQVEPGVLHIRPKL